MTSVKKPEWPFYGAWIILTVLCVPIAFILSFPIMKLVTNIVGGMITVDGVQHITEDYLFMYAFIPIAGLLTGLVQYLLLRRVLPGMGWWVAATFLAWSVEVLLLFGSREVDSETLSVSIFTLLLGLSIGVGQWLVLRGHVPRAGWWIVANVAGWGLLALVMGDSFGLFGFLLIGVLPAAATAVALALLLNQAPPVELQGA